MDKLVQKIINRQTDNMICLVSGNVSFKLELEEIIKSYIGGIVTIPRFFIETNRENEELEDDRLDTLSDLITVRMLTAEYLIIHLDSFDNLSAAHIKELVHGELFRDMTYRIVGREFDHRKVKLIIVSELDFRESFFPDEKALLHRCNFL